jgi:hypothetical protein
MLQHVMRQSKTLLSFINTSNTYIKAKYSFTILKRERKAKKKEDNT